MIIEQYVDDILLTTFLHIIGKYFPRFVFAEKFPKYIKNELKNIIDSKTFEFYAQFTQQYHLYWMAPIDCGRSNARYVSENRA